MLGKAVQIINRRDLVLENEERTWLRAEITYMFRPDSHNEQKTLAFEVPLQAELRFPSAGTNNPTPRGKACRVTEER
jgi:hypothetical protein